MKLFRSNITTKIVFFNSCCALMCIRLHVSKLMLITCCVADTAVPSQLCTTLGNFDVLTIHFSLICWKNLSVHSQISLLDANALFFLSITFYRLLDDSARGLQITFDKYRCQHIHTPSLGPVSYLLNSTALAKSFVCMCLVWPPCLTKPHVFHVPNRE